MLFHGHIFTWWSSSRSQKANPLPREKGEYWMLDLDLNDCIIKVNQNDKNFRQWTNVFWNHLATLWVNYIYILETRKKCNLEFYLFKFQFSTLCILFFFCYWLNFFRFLVFNFSNFDNIFILNINKNIGVI